MIVLLFYLPFLKLIKCVPFLSFLFETSGIPSQLPTVLFWFFYKYGEDISISFFLAVSEENR